MNRLVVDKRHGTPSSKPQKHQFIGTATPNNKTCTPFNPYPLRLWRIKSGSQPLNLSENLYAAGTAAKQ